VWWVREAIDLDRVKAAASRFRGMHDFQAFSDDDPEEKSTDVLLEEVEIAEDGDLILIRVSGSHFIWKMVRRMVGVLVAVGKQEIAPDAIANLLGPPRSAEARSAKADLARLTAPASGLFLERVFYEGDPRRWPLRPAAPVGPPRG
jgi:tRNA pseudouridine38-40 synthase